MRGDGGVFLFFDSRKPRPGPVLPRFLSIIEKGQNKWNIKSGNYRIYVQMGPQIHFAQIYFKDATRSY